MKEFKSHFSKYSPTRFRIIFHQAFCKYREITTVYHFPSFSIHCVPSNEAAKASYYSILLTFGNIAITSQRISAVQSL